MSLRAVTSSSQRRQYTSSSARQGPIACCSSAAAGRRTTTSSSEVAMKRIAVLLVCAAACKSAPPPAPAAPKEDGRAARNTVVSAPDRSAADKDLDPGRKPAEMIAFLEVRPGMKVEDMGAGGGYTTELIARAVGPSGTVYMQNDPRWLSFLKDALAERFTHPAMKDVVRAEVPFDDPVPPGAKDLDLVVLNVIYHDIVNMPVDRLRM